ncbi:unnamed protein product [Priceomyces carsonii]|nr:unnamed protein product [Priceomyces carsonii]
MSSFDDDEALFEDI